MALTKLLSSVAYRVFPMKPVHAHCDIPCGIYDPHMAQIAALTTIRMNQLINGLANQNLPAEQKQAQMARYVATKEHHAELCKQELRVLWGDYFRPEHVQQYPNLHDQFFSAMKLASRVRQEVNLQAAQDLLGKTQEIAETFWKTKGATTRRQPSLQGAVGGELVYPVPQG